MKAFEEWWLMEGQNIVGHYDQQERYLAHDVWRAALEWALSGLPDIDEIQEELKCL